MTDNKEIEVTERATGLSSGSRTGLLYLAAGGAIGATLALLFAPKTGSDFRSDISDVTRRGYDGTLERANKLKNQSTDLYQSVRGKTGHLMDAANQNIEDAFGGTESSATSGRAPDEASLLELEEKFNQRPSNGSL